MLNAIIRATAALAAVAVPAFTQLADAESPATETILFIRHAEKPDLGLGQLNCKGLNRALALPAVLSREFGRPDAIFAPDPAQAKTDHGVSYSYVRPLATVEPAAIVFGLPVDAAIGFADDGALQRKLAAPDYRGSLVLVAWEHAVAAKVVRDMVAQDGGDPGAVPDWPSDDFDSIYVVRITRSGGQATAVFEHRHEGLDGGSDICFGGPGRS
jgi:hypothetical protein